MSPPQFKFQLRHCLLDLDRLDAYCGFVCVRSLRGSCREAFCLCRRGIEGVPDRRAEAGVNLARSRTTQLDVVQSCLALGRAKDDTNLIDNNMLCWHRRCIQKWENELDIPVAFYAWLALPSFFLLGLVLFWAQGPQPLVAVCKHKQSILSLTKG